MRGLYIVTLLSLAISLVMDRRRTGQALRVAARKLRRILPDFLHLMIVLSFVMLVSDSVIVRLLSAANPWLGLSAGLAIGSITMMPGFVSYPLAGVLAAKGVPMLVIAGFVTSLMMVGIVTYPVERTYFGVRLTLLRNGVSLVMALLISVAIGLAYGEFV